MRRALDLEWRHTTYHTVLSLERDLTSSLDGTSLEVMILYKRRVRPATIDPSHIKTTHVWGRRRRHSKEWTSFVILSASAALKHLAPVGIT